VFPLRAKHTQVPSVCCEQICDRSYPISCKRRTISCCTYFVFGYICSGICPSVC